VDFAITDITDICWDEFIFDQLAIPPESKTLIRASQLNPPKLNIHIYLVLIKATKLYVLLVGSSVFTASEGFLSSQHLRIPTYEHREIPFSMVVKTLELIIFAAK
jgi:hypothetical protein